jgi:GntR family transcriptional regulator, transcriptional repressor for pyruvate dehydrogenase complex
MVRHLNFTDPDYLMKLMVARRMIETEIADILTSPEGRMNTEVEQALRDMRHSPDIGDFSGFIESDVAFHGALTQSAGNEILPPCSTTISTARSPTWSASLERFHLVCP